MPFREDSEAARARIDALERKLAEAERENERLRAGAGPSQMLEVRQSVLRKPGLWLGATAAMLGTAALIELDGGRPPWDELFPFLGAGSIFCTIAAVVTAFWRTARSSEVLVLSGRKHHAPDGRTIGYRVLAPGQSGFKVPVLEHVERLDTGAFPVEVVLERAFTQDFPVEARIKATIALATSSPGVDHAVERFLGRPRGDVAQAARQAIETSARTALAKVPAQQAQTERALVADEIRRVAEEDLEKLGIVLLTLGLAEVRPS